MSLSTRPIPALRSETAAKTASQVTPSRDEMNPVVGQIARSVRAVGPETRLAVVFECLRQSPYHVVPVVEGRDDLTDDHPTKLLGLIGEDEVLRLLLDANTPEERAQIRELPASEIMTSPLPMIARWERTATLGARFLEAGRDVLPVVDHPDSGYFLGLVARTDLVSELVRPFRPPTVGGMATPLGVYLTTGNASGGVGTLALATTGLFTFALQLVSFAAFYALYLALHRSPETLAWTRSVPISVRTVFATLIPLAIQTGLFLGLLRLSPLAGYHAAEHQVVHAIERGEPLVPEIVRTMPRVHPRCSTNLVAGGLLLWLTGTALQFIPLGIGWLVGAMVAFSYWKPVGAFLQERFTTRPASDREIESGIAAAHDVLNAHSQSAHIAPRPHQRLWRMGFAQILLGASSGLAFLYLLAQFFPPLQTYLDALATF